MHTAGSAGSAALAVGVMCRGDAGCAGLQTCQSCRGQPGVQQLVGSCRGGAAEQQTAQGGQEEPAPALLRWEAGEKGRVSEASQVRRHAGERSYQSRDTAARVLMLRAGYSPAVQGELALPTAEGNAGGARLDGQGAACSKLKGRGALAAVGDTHAWLAAVQGGTVPACLL
jgi:hypothetical protein